MIGPMDSVNPAVKEPVRIAKLWGLDIFVILFDVIIIVRGSGLLLSRYEKGLVKLSFSVGSLVLRRMHRVCH
jgi:hypothetical protein